MLSMNTVVRVDMGHMQNNENIGNGFNGNGQIWQSVKTIFSILDTPVAKIDCNTRFAGVLCTLIFFLSKLDSHQSDQATLLYGALFMTIGLAWSLSAEVQPWERGD